MVSNLYTPLTDKGMKEIIGVMGIDCEEALFSPRESTGEGGEKRQGRLRGCKNQTYRKRVAKRKVKQRKHLYK